LLLVEPRALDVEQAQSGKAGERERIQGELRDRLVGARVRPIVKNMNGAVAYLNKVYVASEDARGVSIG